MELNIRLLQILVVDELIRGIGIQLLVELRQDILLLVLVEVLILARARLSVLLLLRRHSLEQLIIMISLISIANDFYVTLISIKAASVLDPNFKLI